MPPSLHIQSSSSNNAPIVRKKKTGEEKKTQLRSGRRRTKELRTPTETNASFNRENGESNNTGDISMPDVTTSEAPSLGFPNNNPNGLMQNQMPLGMYSTPFYGGYGAMSPMLMPGSPFSGVYQALFGVQNVVFSLGQAVQILGMNQHAIQQAFDSLVSMFDHAIITFNEIRAMEAMEIEKETKEQKRRRQRLKAIRWAIMMAGSWLAYKLIHRIIKGRRRRAIGNGIHPSLSTYSSAGYSHPQVGFGSVHSSGMYGGYSSGSSLYGNSPMFGGVGQSWTGANYY